jgi:hypothetical protein
MRATITDMGAATGDASVRVKLKGSRTMTTRAMVRRLEDALENLSGTSCTFWACTGPQHPRHMITCTRCWGIRDINVVLAALKRRTG